MFEVCDRYLSHRFTCAHPGKVFHWETYDGCNGDLCPLCVLHPESQLNLHDLKWVSLIGKMTLPQDRRDYSKTDQLYYLLNALQGRMAGWSNS